jgi:hypothetical protein
MDDGRFDAWTRRRFGLATGGLLAAVLGLAAVDEGAAKKHKHKHKHHHKHKPKKTCQPDETLCGTACVAGTCCPGTACGANCDCFLTVEDTSFCSPTFALIVCEQCESSADCPEGFQCVPDTGCPGLTALCYPPCTPV